MLIWRKLGLAFQIMDDALDYADAADMGKNTGDILPTKELHAYNHRLATRRCR